MATKLCGHTRIPLIWGHKRAIFTDVNQKIEYDECFKILNLSDSYSEQELKESFISLAKKYHPDGQMPTADANKFAQVEKAYRILQHKLNKEKEKEKQTTENDSEKDYGIKHTAPQHRQYLEFDGIGSGTPTQRQHQYQNYRVNRVTDTVFEHRMQKMAVQSENALVVKDKQAAKKHKIRNTIDRLVEDLIQESMSKGDFDNLPGQGKPIVSRSSHNPFLDTATHKLNEVLINNGYTPDWILLQKEIREEKRRIVDEIVLNGIRFRFRKFPLDKDDSDKWFTFISGYEERVKLVNEKIDKFNLLVPFLYKQQAHIQIQRLAEKTIPEIQELQGKINIDDIMYKNTNSGQQMPSPDIGGGFWGTFLKIFS